MSVVWSYLFVAVVVGMLGAHAIVVSHILGVRPSLPPTGRSLLTRLVRAERRRAVRLGWSLRTWLSLRAATVALAAVAGVVAGIPVVAVGAPLLALAALPWALDDWGEWRQLKLAELWVTALRSVHDRIGAVGLNEALIDLGRQPLSGLEAITAPLAAPAAGLDEALVEVAERSGSAFVEHVVVTLMIARSRSQSSLRSLLGETIIPDAESRLAGAYARHRAISYQRGVIWMMCGVLGGALTFLIALVPSFRAYYQSGAGQLVLLGDLLLLGLFVAAVNVTMRPAREPRFDLARVREVCRG